MTIEQGLSPKQLDFMHGSSGRVNILDGSIRSGKTIVSLLRWLIFIAPAPLGGVLLMVGRSRDSVWRNTIAPLQDTSLFGPLTKHVIGNYGVPTVRILGRMSVNGAQLFGTTNPDNPP